MLAYLLTVLFTLLIMRRRIAEPIQRLKEGAEAIGTGDLDHTITTNSDDEIDALAVSFNTMAVRLKDSTVSIDQLHREVERQTEALRAAMTEANAANQAKTQFLSHISHELLTPMTAIVGFTQLLQDDTRLDADAAENVAEIHQASQHLLGLINDMLDITRIESKRLTLNIATVPMPTALQEAVSLTTPQASAHNINITTACADPTLTCQADPLRLRQVLVNLITNAIKYTPDAGRVSIVCEPVNHQYICIHITDTGLGIGPDDLEHIFEPFFRADNHRHRIDGLGLGLNIARSLADAMGGDLTVTSVPQQGSTFSVYLPRRAQD